MTCQTVIEAVEKALRKDRFVLRDCHREGGLLTTAEKCSARGVRALGKQVSGPIRLANRTGGQLFASLDIARRNQHAFRRLAGRHYVNRGRLGAWRQQRRVHEKCRCARTQRGGGENHDRAESHRGLSIMNEGGIAGICFAQSPGNALPGSALLGGSSADCSRDSGKFRTEIATEGV